MAAAIATGIALAGSGLVRGIAESGHHFNIPGMFCGVAVALCGGDWHL
jgi:hypothetical protein